MPVGLSHVSLTTGKDNFDTIRRFYTKTLPFLGYKIFMEKPGVYVAMQPQGGEPVFWLHPGHSGVEKWDGNVEGRSKTHVAFHATSRNQVDD
jgi:hypothetical protein